MFQNDQLKKLDDRYNNHAYTGLMGIFMRYCHEQLEKIEFPKNISKVLEIGAGSAPHIKYIKHNFDEYHIIETSDYALRQDFDNSKAAKPAPVPISSPDSNFLSFNMLDKIFRLSPAEKVLLEE